MSMIPHFHGGRRSSSVFDPFSLSIWDSFKDLDFPQISRENAVFVNTRVDWKETNEAHVFKADLPGMKKEEVKVEIEDDRVLQISGRETSRNKTRTTRGIASRGAVASSPRGSGCRRT
ncbi:17.5 kDa class I heat shock protein [Hibiscus syriacus]|uniref:17.5 kDa class I heat shock protein n=1 Tax=Hibiscus syriacus TaxID=106335 RepID=A0A6A3CZW6_HIBSY|nr:17.5 kDa class I heat shock protein [Hibiscus syriacus]